MRKRNTQITSIYQALRHVEGSQVPALTSSLESLRGATERILAVDLANAIRPAEDDVVRIRASFETFSRDARSRLEAIRANLTGARYQIDQLGAGYRTVLETSEAAATELFAALQRAREVAESAATRVNQVESVTGQVLSNLRSVAAKVQGLARPYSDRIAAFRSETSGAIGATAQQWREAVKRERAQQASELAAIRSRLQAVARVSQDSAGQLNAAVTNARSQFQASLATLTQSARAVCTACQSLVDTSCDDVESMLNQFVADNNQEFDSITVDVESTIQALRNFVMAGKDGLQAAVAGLARERSAGERDVIGKYDQLKSEVTARLTEQGTRMRQLQDEAVATVVGECQSLTGAIREDLTIVQSELARADELERRVGALLNSVEKSKAEWTLGVGELMRRYDELSTTAARVSDDLDRRQRALDARLAALEDPEAVEGFASRDEALQVFRRTRALLDDRLGELEAWVRRVNQAIAESIAARAQEPDRRAGLQEPEELAIAYHGLQEPDQGG